MFGHISTYSYSNLDQLLQSSHAGKLANRISTGIDSLDEITGGLKPGGISFLAGRPGMGKSMLATNIILNVAKSPNKLRVIHLSDAPFEQTITDMLSRESRIDRINIVKSAFNNISEKKMVEDAYNSINSLPIYLERQPTINLDQLINSLELVTSDNKESLIVIDSIDLLRTQENGWKKSPTLEEYLDNLKCFSSQNNSAIIIICNADRSVEKRKDHRPILADVQFSEVIQSHADSIICLYRDEVYNECSNSDSLVEAYTLWNTRMCVGTTLLKFNPKEYFLGQAALL